MKINKLNSAVLRTRVTTQLKKVAENKRRRAGWCTKQPLGASFSTWLAAALISWQQERTSSTKCQRWGQWVITWIHRPQRLIDYPFQPAITFQMPNKCNCLVEKWFGCHRSRSIPNVKLSNYDTLISIFRSIYSEYDACRASQFSAKSRSAFTNPDNQPLDALAFFIFITLNSTDTSALSLLS